MRLPNSWSRARVTLAISVVTAAAWIVVVALGLDEWAASMGGFVPAAVTADIPPSGAPVWLRPLTAALVHYNWIHIGFNLLILVFCGRPVEAVLGPASMVVLYVLGAYAAAAGQYLIEPHSLVPMIGASGAISAVLGAYATLFGRNKVRVANPTLALWLNALWLMAAWIALQVVIGLVTMRLGIGIAIGAHIGGFLVGVLLARPLLLFRYRKA